MLAGASTDLASDDGGGETICLGASTLEAFGVSVAGFAGADGGASLAGGADGSASAAGAVGGCAGLEGAASSGVGGGKEGSDVPSVLICFAIVSDVGKAISSERGFAGFSAAGGAPFSDAGDAAAIWAGCCVREASASGSALAFSGCWKATSMR